MISEKSQIAIRNFTDLNAWKASHVVVLETYKLTKKFPSDERFGLTSQMRRAAVSITSNIAEGFGRRSYKEKVQFFYQSQGSLTELKNQMIIARDISYLPIKTYQEIDQQMNVAHQLLQGLIQKSRSFIKP